MLVQRNVFVAGQESRGRERKLALCKFGLCKHCGGGREERARLRTCHTYKGARLSGSACKNGTSRKSFEEAYSTVEVARQACTAFASSTSAGVAKTAPRPVLPFLTWRLLRPSSKNCKSIITTKNGTPSKWACRSVLAVKLISLLRNVCLLHPSLLRSRMLQCSQGVCFGISGNKRAPIRPDPG